VAEKAARVGIAEAIAIEEKVRAYGGPQFQVTQQVMNRFAEAIEHAGVDVVPRISISGSGSGNGTSSGSSLMEGLMAMLLSDRMGEQLSGNSNAIRPEAAAMRDQIMKGLMAEQAQELPSIPATVPTTPLKPNGTN
jgi:hypothetical protein